MRLIKKIIYYTAAITSIFVIAVTAIVCFYEKEVKQYIVGELNKSIRIKVSVKSIDFTVLRYFPNASITFKEVYARNTIDDDTLCNARHISLLFNLKDVFNGNYIIRRIYVYDGTIKLAVDEAGNSKYKFWDTETATNRKFAIQLTMLKAEKLKLVYENNNLHRMLKAHINEMDLSGNFSDAAYMIDTRIEGILEKYKIENTTVINNKTVSLKLNLAAKGNSYTITTGHLLLTGIALTAEGTFNIESERTKMDVFLSAKQLDLVKLSALLPNQYLDKAKYLKYAGTSSLTLQAKGFFSKTQLPNIDGIFRLNHGEITWNDSAKTTVHEIALTGLYSNHSANGKDLLSINNISLKIKNGKLTGSLTITNLQNPYVKVKVNALFSANDLLALANQSQIKELTGEVDLNMTTAGQLEWLKNKENYANGKVIFNAVLHVKNVGFSILESHASVARLNGTFENDGGSLAFKDLSGLLNGSDFMLNGSVQNFLPALFNNTIPVSITGSLFSHVLDINKLLAITRIKNDTISKASSHFNFTKALLTVDIANAKFKKLDVQRLSAKMQITPKAYKLENASFNALKGNIKLDGELITTAKDSTLLRGNAKIKGINISELFAKLDNFGQSTLTAININGNLTADIVYAASLNNKGELNSKTLKIASDLTVDNGELLNFTPVMALSKHIKLKELEDVRFSRLKNQIAIENGVITIPEMEISSTALNLKVSGTHMFNNQIDYKLQLRLSELLGRKVRSQSTEFGEIEDDGSGKTIIPVHMYGDMANPKITIDKIAVKTRVTNNFKQEWQLLKATFKKEFKTENEPSSTTGANALEKEIDLNAPIKKTMPATQTMPEQHKTRLQKLKEKLKGDDEDQ